MGLLLELLFRVDLVWLREELILLRFPEVQIDIVEFQEPDLLCWHRWIGGSLDFEVQFKHNGCAI